MIESDVINFASFSLPEEIWKRHSVYTRYYGSTMGRVWAEPISYTCWNRFTDVTRHQPGGLVTLFRIKSGYQAFQCQYPRKQLKVSHFILECFIGFKPVGFHACHGNGIRYDDRLENLRWDTPKANMADRNRHGTTNRMFNERNPLTKIPTDVILKIRHDTDGMSNEEVAIIYKISTTHVQRIKTYKTRTKA